MICQCQHEQAAHEHNRDGTDCAPADRLRELYALALLEGLGRRCPLPPMRPAALPYRAPRLDDTGRAPFVPLQPNGGGRG